MAGAMIWSPERSRDIEPAVAAMRRLAKPELKTLAAELNAGGSGADLLANVEYRLRGLTPDARAKQAADMEADRLSSFAEHCVFSVWAGNFSPNAVVPTMERFGLTYQQYAAEYGQGTNASERIKAALLEFTLAECRSAVAALDQNRPDHKRVLAKAARIAPQVLLQHKGPL